MMKALRMRERKEHYIRERDQFSYKSLDAIRRDYGIDEELLPQQYPVEKQASKINDTPVHSIGMEKQCGKMA